MSQGARWGLVLVLAACSSKRPSAFAECDALVAAAEKAATCPTLPSDARTRLQASAKQMKATIEQISQGGGPDNAPPELVEYVRDACKAQLSNLQTDPNLAACTK
ncbi:MAG: hypothetical protein SFX73_09890 [Kofleriaceae bacterium]|nr:hypothetical protein [Kofleriaceae bacterium]